MSDSAPEPPASAPLAPEDLRRSPSPLAGDYAMFGVGDRLLLSGPSHQAWPDVALEGVVEAFDDAARHVDEKWGRAFAKADELRVAVGALLGDPGAPVDGFHATALRQAFESRKVQKSGDVFGHGSITIA